VTFAIDANLLVYASDASSAVNLRAAAFVRNCAAGPDICCLAWPTLSAYLRISTHAGIFQRPLTPVQAMNNIDQLISRPHVRTIGEEGGFWQIYRDLSLDTPPRGNQVPDTHLAALLRQHGIGTLYTRDRDFRRFDFLEVVDPLADELQDAPRKPRSRRGRRVLKLADG
jgi:hypothetical protein